MQPGSATQMLKLLTAKNLQNLTLTFGEKQRLFDHIESLERQNQFQQEEIHKLKMENQILSKFKYTHVDQKIEKVLP